MFQSYQWPGIFLVNFSGCDFLLHIILVQIQTPNPNEVKIHRDMSLEKILFSKTAFVSLLWWWRTFFFPRAFYSMVTTFCGGSQFQLTESQPFISYLHMGVKTQALGLGRLITSSQGQHNVSLHVYPWGFQFHLYFWPVVPLFPFKVRYTCEVDYIILCSICKCLYRALYEDYQPQF